MTLPWNAPAEDDGTIVDVITRHATSRPDRVAFRYLDNGRDESDLLRYGDLLRTARAIADGLLRYEARGGRLLLCLDSGLDFVRTLFGCLYAGLAAVPVDLPRVNRSFARFEGIVLDCNPAALVTGKLEAERVAWLRQHIPQLARVPTYLLDDLMETPQAGAAPAGPTADDLAVIQYTSGSTRCPRGVVVTHGNLIANQVQIRTAFGHDEGTKFVGWLPLFHDMGLMGNVLQPAFLGVESVLMPPVRFVQRPLRWLQAISQFRGTTSGAPNFAFDHCVRRIPDEEVGGLELSSWRVAFNGAEPIRGSTLRTFAHKFGAVGFSFASFLPCYGLAEATLFVSGCKHDAPPTIRSFSRSGLERNRAVSPPTPSDEDQLELVSCGPCGARQDVRIVDPDALVEVPPSVVGEIWLSGPNIARGYFGDEAHSRQSFGARLPHADACYLRTGDLGFLRDGELFIAGRLKDLIVIKGRNLYPQDIEYLTQDKHPSFLPGRCVAFAVDVDGAERVVLIQEVSSRRVHADELARAVASIQADLVRHCEATAHEILLVEPRTIPTTSSGKVQRQAARMSYLNGHFQSVPGAAEIPGARPRKALTS